MSDPFELALAMGYCPTCYTGSPQRFTQLAPGAARCRTHAAHGDTLDWELRPPTAAAQAGTDKAVVEAGGGWLVEERRRREQAKARPSTSRPTKGPRGADRRTRKFKELSKTGQKRAQRFAETPTDWTLPASAAARLLRLRERYVILRGRETQANALAVLEAHEDPGWYASRLWRTRATVAALAALGDGTGAIQATGTRIADVATGILARWQDDPTHVFTGITQMTISSRSAYEILRWLQDDAEILACLLRGASAEALGAAKGRAGAYALLGGTREIPWQPPTPKPSPVDNDVHKGLEATFAQLTTHCGRIPHSPEGPSSDEIEIPSEYNLHPSKVAAARRVDPLRDSRCPQSSSARYQAARYLRSRAGWRDITAARLALILDRWYDAGWNNDSLLHATDHKPGGEAHPSANLRANNRGALLISRLKHWLGDDGLPMAPPIAAVAPYARVIRPGRTR